MTWAYRRKVPMVPLPTGLHSQARSLSPVPIIVVKFDVL